MVLDGNVMALCYQYVYDPSTKVLLCYMSKTVFIDVSKCCFHAQVQV